MEGPEDSNGSARPDSWPCPSVYPPIAPLLVLRPSGFIATCGNLEPFSGRNTHYRVRWQSRQRIRPRQPPIARRIRYT